MKFFLHRRPVISAFLFGIVVFLFSSCKPSTATSQRDNLFLAPDLYLHAQWEAEQRLTEAFLTQLEADARNPASAGQALAGRLAQFKKDRTVIHRMNEKWIAELNTYFDPRGVASDKLPPKPPPPPPPIIEDPTKFTPTVFAAHVKANVPLMILFAPTAGNNTEVKLYQGGTVSAAKAVVKRNDGLLQVRVDIASFKPGPAVLQLPAAGSRAPVYMGVLIVK